MECIEQYLGSQASPELSDLYSPTIEDIGISTQRKFCSRSKTRNVWVTLRNDPVEFESLCEQHLKKLTYLMLSASEIYDDKNSTATGFNDP